MTMIEIVDIRTNGGTQPREAINAETVAEYAEAMRRGDKFPPVDLIYDGSVYWLVDGFHRILAATSVGNRKISASVGQGTLEQAQWNSFGVNGTHGLRRTTADKQRAVTGALRHPLGAGKSNRQIAGHCGIDEGTVRNYRAKLEGTAEIPHIENRTVQRGDSTYKVNTANIGQQQVSDARIKAAAAQVMSEPRTNAIDIADYDPLKRDEALACAEWIVRELVKRNYMPPLSRVLVRNPIGLRSCLVETHAPDHVTYSELAYGYGLDGLRTVYGTTTRSRPNVGNGATVSGGEVAAEQPIMSFDYVSYGGESLNEGAWHRTKMVGRMLFDAGRWDGQEKLHLVAPTDLHRRLSKTYGDCLRIDELVSDRSSGELVISAPPEVEAVEDTRLDAEPHPDVHTKYQKGMAATCLKCVYVNRMTRDEATYTNWTLETSSPAIWQCPRGHRASDPLMRIVAAAVAAEADSYPVMDTSWQLPAAAETTVEVVTASDPLDQGWHMSGRVFDNHKLFTNSKGSFGPGFYVVDPFNKRVYFETFARQMDAAQSTLANTVWRSIEEHYKGEILARGAMNVIESSRVLVSGCGHYELMVLETAEQAPAPPAIIVPQRYGVILADPPWKYTTWSEDTGAGRSAESHFPTMLVDDIAAMPVGELADRNCALFMWATWPTIRDAFVVAEAWGFEYRTAAFTWAKLSKKCNSWGPYDAVDERIWHFGMGNWTRANSEVCLLFTRGEPKRMNADVRQLIAAPVREHSRKPDEQYERIERLISGPYLELFARYKRPGWHSWGNEIESDITFAGIEAAR